nr:MAG TPA: putative Fe-S oxidoreductase [Caudoviricetes sp.]
MVSSHPRYNAKPEYRLTYASLTFNSKCNAGCQNCCGQILNKPDMPLEKIKEVLDVVIQGLRIREVYPSCSAEMTLIPYINVIVKYMEKIKIPGLIVTQDTNGRVIPEGFIETLNSVTFTYHVSISIWGWDSESWNKYQGKGSFEKVTGNIRRYLLELKYPPTFSFPYITDEQYQKTLEFVKNLCAEYGYETKAITDGTMSNITNIKNNGIIPVFIRKYSQRKNEESKSMGVYEKGKLIDYIPFNNCGNLFSPICIDSLGNIYPCTGMNSYKPAIIGNVNDYSPFTYKNLIEILHGEKAMKYLHDNYTSGKFACDICKSCSARICN